MLMALETLPCAYQVAPPLATGEPGSLWCRFEPLQVCDQGDSSLVGALANLQVLVPGAPALIVTPEILRLIAESASLVNDEFKPPIDHPPQLSA